MRISDVDELKQQLRTEWARLYDGISGIGDSSRSVMRVFLYTFACNIFTRCCQLYSDLVILEFTVAVG